MKRRILKHLFFQVLFTALCLGYYWLRKGNVTPNFIVFCIFLIPALFALRVGWVIGRSGGRKAAWPLYILLAGALPTLCYYCTYFICDPPRDLAEVLLPPVVISAVFAIIGLGIGAFSRKMDSAE